MDESTARGGKLARIASAGMLAGETVHGVDNEPAGKIDEVVLDLVAGRIMYVVVAPIDTSERRGRALLAIPWGAFKFDESGSIGLSVTGEQLKLAPGFDKAWWPDMASDEFERQVHEYYGYPVPSNSPRGDA